MSATALTVKSDRWSSIEFSAPTAGVTAGAFYVVGSIIGIVVETKTLAQTGVLIYRCDSIDVPKASGAITKGAKVYYHSATGNVSTDASLGTLIGRCRVAALTGDTTVNIDLEGSCAA